jgi:hypothetical protein
MPGGDEEQGLLRAGFSVRGVRAVLPVRPRLERRGPVMEWHTNATVLRLADPPPDRTLHGLWKPYEYRGLGFDIYDPYPDEESDN